MKNLIVSTKGAQTVQILDTVNIAEPVYKYTTEYEANQHGMNLHDGANKLGEVSVTKYIGVVLTCQHKVKKRGDVITLKPSDIDRII